MKVIVGLGNPGPQYAGTRHNVGFDVVDYLAAGPGVRVPRAVRGVVAEAKAATAVLLVKPQTFMNLSGRAVRPGRGLLQAGGRRTCWWCATTSTCRWASCGSGERHARRAQRVAEHPGAPRAPTAYARLRIGVGGPEDDAVDHVLAKFQPGRAGGDRRRDRAGRRRRSLVWVRQGVEACMNRFNRTTRRPPRRRRKETGAEDDEPQEGPKRVNDGHHVYECLMMLDTSKVAGDMPAAIAADRTTLPSEQGPRSWPAGRGTSADWPTRSGGQKKALYYLIYFETDAANLVAIEHDFKLNESVLRYVTCGSTKNCEETMLALAPRPACNGAAGRGRGPGR